MEKRQREYASITALIRYGTIPDYVRLQARGDLEKKKRVFASLGLLVPLTKVSLW